MNFNFFHIVNCEVVDDDTIMFFTVYQDLIIDPLYLYISGGNESGLKKFLLKYPSLFTVNGNMVSLFDGSKAIAQAGESNGGGEAVSSGSSGASGHGGGAVVTARPLPDVSIEMEAVQFFQTKLVKKEERWVPIRSLAGHLSQASEQVRECVGPQLEFRKWLLRHPHIFEVQGELVGLRDNLAAMATPAVPTRKYNVVHNGVDPSPATLKAPPKTPPATRRNLPPKTPPTVRRSKSFSEQRVTGPPPVPSDVSFAMPTTPGSRRRAPVTMTANEYKAVMFLKDIIEKKGGIRMHNITGHFSQAPEGVRNTIGWTKMELEEFLKKNAAMFHVSEDEVVTLHKNAKMNVIITGSRPQGQNVRTLSGRKGKIFHVAKLWGIIDLGKHEHVFFDKSIMKRPIDDLQKEYKVGETLNFNAVLAPKTSRAKWRAIHVWKEQEDQPSAGETESEFSRAENNESPLLSPAISIEEEINRFLPQRNEVEPGDVRYIEMSPSSSITIVTDSGSDVAATLNNNVDNKSGSSPQGSPRRHSDGPEDLRPKLNGSVQQPADKPKMTTLNIAGNKVLVETAIIDGTAINTVTAKRPQGILKTDKQTCEVACQTISTGEIIATQLYHDK